MYAVSSGEGEACAQSQHDLIAYGTMFLTGITLLLFLTLKGHRRMLPVMTNLPFALVSGVLSVVVAGGNLSLDSMVGFVTFPDISLCSLIILISRYERLVHANDPPWSMDTTVHEVSERLVPILMTTLVTALALLPFVVMSGAASNEIEGPMAIVILGGLITSIVLNLIVLPTLALHYGHFERDMFAEPDRATGGIVMGGES